MEQKIVVKDDWAIWWEINRDFFVRLCEMDNRRRRPRVVEDPVKALTWVRERKFERMNDRYWISLLDIAGMALAAAGAAFRAESTRRDAEQRIQSTEAPVMAGDAAILADSQIRASQG